MINNNNNNKNKNKNKNNKNKNNYDILKCYDILKSSTQ